MERNQLFQSVSSTYALLSYFIEASVSSQEDAFHSKAHSEGAFKE